MENACIQLHPSHDTIALVNVGVWQAPQGADRHEKGPLCPAAVHNEGSSPKHVKEKHGHHSCDYGCRIIHDLCREQY